MTDSASLPPDWQTVQLGELGDIFGGSTPSTKAPEYWNGDIPWLTPSEVTKSDSLSIAETERHITLQGLSSCAAKLLPSGTVMMTSRATIGEVAINAVPMATNQGFINVIGKEDKVCSEFLAYWIKQNRSLFEDRAYGATFKELSKSNFKTIAINLPPLAEQHAIAHVLRTVQQAREARQREIGLERESKAALMQRLFTHGTRGEPRKQTEIGEMPENWKVVRLGEISRVSSGGTPDRSQPSYWNGSIPWVKTGEIDYNTIIETSEGITEEGLKNSSAKLYAPGTLLMAMYGQGVTRGRVALLGIDAAINQACAAIIASESVLSEYLFHLFAFSYDKIRNLGHGANQTNINALIIKSIQVPLPTLPEQQEIASMLCACDAKIEALEREVDKLDELFRALLEELMTGRLSALLATTTVAEGG